MPQPTMYLEYLRYFIATHLLDDWASCISLFCKSSSILYNPDFCSCTPSHSLSKQTSTSQTGPISQPSLNHIKLKKKKKIKRFILHSFQVKTVNTCKQWIPASLDMSPEHLSKQMWTENPSRQTAVNHWTGCNISCLLKYSFTTFNFCHYHTLMQAHIVPHSQKLETYAPYNQGITHEPPETWLCAQKQAACLSITHFGAGFLERNWPLLPDKSKRHMTPPKMWEKNQDVLHFCVVKC